MAEWNELETLQRAWDAGHDEALGGALREALERRVAAGEATPALRLRLGRLLDALGRTDEAIAHLQFAKQGIKERGPAGFALGVCFARKRLWKLSVDELQAALDVCVPGEEAWKDAAYLLGRIYEQAGKRERAIALYSAIAGDDGDGPSMVGASLRPTDPPHRPPEALGGGAAATQGGGP